MDVASYANCRRVLLRHSVVLVCWKSHHSNTTAIFYTTQSKVNLIKVYAQSSLSFSTPMTCAEKAHGAQISCLVRPPDWWPQSDDPLQAI
jgi:hypothetical protein